MLKNKKSYQWDASQYAQHSGSQYAWGLELIKKLRLTGHETVLDIGCGDGKLTAIIADHLPQGSVIGIDSSKDMVDLARRRHTDYPHSRLEFEHLDVRELAENNRFDLVFSNAALHWIKHHPPVLLRIEKALKSGGRLLFQMGGKGNAEQVIAVLDTLIKQKWAAYFSEFSFPYGFYGPQTYSQWLVDAGLKVVRVELIEKDMRHQGKEGFAGWIRSTWLPYLERVPPHTKELFIDDIVESYLKDRPLDDDGTVHVRMKRLEVEAVKP
ncbi:MAG: methyltransferase domain-containing protein [Desulfobacterales bacterium]|nr:MAG: methyltransferase domain-containing protein [Desulfobacterales bacterium]